MSVKKDFLIFFLTFLLTFSVIGISPLISNVVAKPDSPVHDAVFQKEMSYLHRPYPYDSLESDESIRRLAETNTEYVAVTVWWQQEDSNSTEIYRKENWTATDEQLKHAVDMIHSLGMKVMLKPMITLEEDEEEPNPWPGQIKGSAEWFENYRAIMNSYAEFTQKNGVELLCIGCEFWSMEENVTQWQEIISGVRARYSGPITYAATFDHYKVVTWWDSLDYVGIDAYFPLTDEYDPTLEELKEAWSRIATDLEDWQTTVNKPIIFTEIGYRSGNGTNIVPWDWQTNMTIDLQEQVDCYEAAFQVLWNKPWFYGFYWWIWESDPEVGGPNNNNFTAQNKPVQYLITSWYSCQRPTLNVQYEELLAKYNNLNTTYHELWLNYTELQSDYDSLRALCNNIQTLLYIFIATTIILIIATIYLATKTKSIQSQNMIYHPLNVTLGILSSLHWSKAQREVMSGYAQNDIMHTSSF